MDKNTSSIHQAATCFSQGKYQQAIKLYQQASKLLGPNMVKTNIWLCEQRLKTPQQKRASASTGLATNIQLQSLQEENRLLKQQLAEKDMNIEDRFRELAILTQMLEEKDREIEKLSKQD